MVDDKSYKNSCPVLICFCYLSETSAVNAREDTL